MPRNTLFKTWEKLLPAGESSTDADIARACYIAWEDGRQSKGFPKSIKKHTKRIFEEKDLVKMIDQEKKERKKHG